MPTNWSEEIVISELTDEPALSEELNALLDGLRAPKGGRFPDVVVNFAAVSYVNSSNLAQLLKLRKILGEHHRHLRLCSVSEEVGSVLSVTGLDKVFRVFPDPLTALASLQIEQEQRKQR